MLLASPIAFSGNFYWDIGKDWIIKDGSYTNHMELWEFRQKKYCTQITIMFITVNGTKPFWKHILYCFPMDK